MRRRGPCCTKKASKKRAVRCEEEVRTEGNCSSDSWQGLRLSQGGLALATSLHFFFFVTVIALTKAGTSEVVAADPTGEMPMVKSPEPGTGQNKQGLSTVGLAALPSPGHRDLETSGTHAGLFLGTK